MVTLHHKAIGGTDRVESSAGQLVSMVGRKDMIETRINTGGSHIWKQLWADQSAMVLRVKY